MVTPPEAASSVYFGGVVGSPTKLSDAGFSTYAVRTAAPIGSAKLNAPVVASTVPQATSTVGPPLRSCVARTVAVAGDSVPDTVRSVVPGGAIGSSAVLTLV